MSEPVRTRRRNRPPESSSTPLAPTTGITIYGCGRDEAALFREAAPRLGLLPTITPDAPSEANAELAHGNRCVSVSHRSPVTHATVRALGRAGVRYISTRSIGSNHIDVAFARSVGVRVGTVTYSPDSVADYTLMLMLMSVRHARSTLRRTDAHDYRLPAAPGRELRDLTVGVVGTGRIGTAVIDRLRAFGSRVVAHDLRRTAAVDYLGLDELLSRSDIVTLHTPLTTDTYHLLDARRIGRLKRGAVLVNTGRGALVDCEALLAALEQGRLGGAALDVVEGEEGTFYADCSRRPVQNDTLLRLQGLPNALITPHTAYYTDHALRDVVESSLMSCLNFERNEQA